MIKYLVLIREVYQAWRLGHIFFTICWPFVDFRYYYWRGYTKFGWILRI